VTAQTQNLDRSKAVMMTVSLSQIGLMSESSKVESYERDCSRADDFITDIHYYKLHIGCLRGPSEAGDGPPPRQDRLVPKY
jgi:hypothetical protein